MTVLIIGGSFQGKREIAEKLYPDEPKIYNLHEKCEKCCKESRTRWNFLQRCAAM